MRIVIADKDPALRDLLRTRLEARKIEVLECSTSLDTLRVLDRQPVDLILISSEMERIDHRLLIDAIRDKPQFVMMPVILITHEKQFSQLVMVRERGYDDFLTLPVDPFVLLLRIHINIEKAKQRVEVNPLTLLPGNHAIEKVIRKKIKSGEKFSVLYLDINNFKAFNDYYSFEKGDDVLCQTAKILLHTASTVARDRECFVGHIGGDDYIVVLSPELEENFARSFLESFDRIIPSFYNETDRKRGYIRVTNRRGRKESFPVMSCSIAACTNLYRPYKNLGEIARDAIQVKAFLKSQQGSHYLRDRRAEPLRGLDEAMKVLTPNRREAPSRKNLMPLGQILIQKQMITTEQLEQALKAHLKTGQKLGQVLTSMNVVRPEEIGPLLGLKLQVPYVSLRQQRPSEDVLSLLKMDFIKINRVIPLSVFNGSLRLGMCDPFDIQIFDTIKRATQLKPIPALVMDDEFDEFIYGEMREMVSTETHE